MDTSIFHFLSKIIYGMNFFIHLNDCQKEPLKKHFYANYCYLKKKKEQEKLVFDVLTHNFSFLGVLESKEHDCWVVILTNLHDKSIQNFHFTYSVKSIFQSKREDIAVGCMVNYHEHIKDYLYSNYAHGKFDIINQEKLLFNYQLLEKTKENKKIKI